MNKIILIHVLKIHASFYVWIQESQVEILEIPECVSIPDHQFHYFHSFGEFHGVAGIKLIEME